MKPIKWGEQGNEAVAGNTRCVYVYYIIKELRAAWNSDQYSSQIGSFTQEQAYIEMKPISRRCIKTDMLTEWLSINT